MRSVWLFPGQGSQAVGMGRALAEQHPRAMACFERAEARLGWDLRTLAWEGPEERLTETQHAQVALFVTSAATVEAWRSLGGPEPDVVAGHSLGEYSALWAAGAIDFDEALDLVARRGQLMAGAATGTMAAVLGLPLESLEAVCTACAETVVVANDNSADQLVLSGTPAGVAEACERAREAGAKRVVPLTVSGAFHSPLMEVAAEPLARALHTVARQSPRVPVVTNVDAQVTRTAEAIPDRLARQLASRVRWADSMRTLRDAGVTTWIEMGSGRVLSGLVKRLDRSLTPLATDTPERLAEALAALVP